MTIGSHSEVRFRSSVHVAMHKQQDYVELYKKDLAKWALLRNITTVMTHNTLLPVRTTSLGLFC